MSDILKKKNLQRDWLILFKRNPIRFIFGFLGLIFIFPGFLHAQNSLNSGDFSTGSWGSGQAMGASAGSSLILTLGVGSSGDKYFRFYGDGSPCGEYQPNSNGDYFTANVPVTSPNGNCGSSNAWRINVPTASSNVVFKTDGVNDGMDASLAFVVQGAVQTVSSVTQSPTLANVYPGLAVTVTANLSGSFATGQAAYLRYTNDGFSTSTVVAMTGSGSTYTASIPAAFNAPSAAITYYVFTSGDSGPASDGSDADLFTINLNNNGGSNYSYTVKTGWTTTGIGNWSNGAGKWNAGVSPPIGVNMGLVTIAHATALNQDALVGSVAINTAITFTLNAATTMEVVNGGTITRAGTGTTAGNATSTTRFLGNGTINWATTWGNLETAGALTATAGQVITTSFQINAGGSISAAPTYGILSALIYNTGGSYGVSNEWTSTAVSGNAGAGRPNDVIIQNGTTLNMTTTNRGIGRDIIIDATSTLNLNATSGDLYLQRNWSNSGTFNPSGRAVGFTGTGNSTLTNSSGETFDYLIITKTTSGNLILNNNITITGNSGDVLQLTSPTAIGFIDLNGKTMTLSGTSGNIYLGNTAAMARQINATGSGTVVISGGTKIVTKGGSASTSSLAFATTVTVKLSNGLNCGAASFTTINGTLQIDNAGFVSTNAPIYGATSTLVYNSTGSYSGGTEWTASADGPAGLGLPNNVTIQNSTTLDMAINFKAMAGNLTIQPACTLNLNASAGDFSLRGNWVNNGGIFNHNNRFVAIRGATSTTIGKSTGVETFRELIINKSVTALSVTLTSDVTISGGSTFALQLITVGIASTLNIDTYTLTLNGTGDINIGTATAATIRTITGTGNLVIGGSAKTVTRNGALNGTLVLGGTALTVLPNSGLNFGAGLTTMNGTLQINSGGSVVTNPPIYGASSMLIYNQGGSINPALEWTQTLGGAATTGRPADVTIDNSTTLTLTLARGMSRHLLVKAGSKLILDAAAGSIVVGGSWTRETGSTFTHNNRLTTLGLVNNTSVIDVPGGEDFGPLTVATKLAATYTTMLCDVTVNGAFALGTAGGRFKIGSNTLTLNGTVSSILNSGTISGDETSNLVINGSGAVCTLFFTTLVAENQLGSLVINRSTAGNVVLATNLTIDNNSGLNNSVLTLTQGWLTVNTGCSLIVNNTSVVGNTSSFVTTLTTGRFGLKVTGSGTYNLNFPIGSVANATSFRPLSFNNVAQTADNLYLVAATVGTAISQNPTFNAPILGGSTVRFFPVDFGNLGVITSIGSVSMTMGADDNPAGIDNQTIIQIYSGAWNDIGASGGSTKTSTSAPDLASATTTFAFGFVTLSTAYVNQKDGNDANTGQNISNMPLGSGPKQTFASAMSVVTNGGTINYTAGNNTAFVAQDWDIDKNIHLTQFGTAANCNLVNVTINVLNKAVMPFSAAQVNPATNQITITGHQLVTGMALRYNNFGEPFGFMPSGINVGTDVLTIGGNVATGQAVIYQAYPAAGVAGGLTHGTTYYAINTSATTIKLAASYADALSATAINITTTGTAESHGVIASVVEGLADATTYYSIVIDANTIQLAASNTNALEGTAIDLITAGRGNHVLVFTPVMTNILSYKNPINITGTSALIDPFTTLVAAGGTINLAAGTFFMQPTILISKQLTLKGDGLGSTILDGGGKISSAIGYNGIAYPNLLMSNCTIRDFTVTRYYNGIYRNNSVNNHNTSNLIESIESLNNYNRGLTWEGQGLIVTALNIRHSIFNYNNGVGVYSAGIYINGMGKTGLNIRNNTCIGN